MDLSSRVRWYGYSLGRDRMLETTDTKHVPRYLVRSGNKKKARLNSISHLLSLIRYKQLPRENVKISKRSNKDKYNNQAMLQGRRFILEVYGDLARPLRR